MLNQQPRIIIHVGAPKTGSTYLQKRLRVDPELLREHGVYVPILKAVEQMAGNAKLLPVAMDKSSSLSFQRVFPSVDVHNLDPRTIVSDLLSDWRRDSEVLLLSAENFRSVHAQKMRKLLPNDVSYTIVLIIRRQDDWVDSNFNQLTKTRDICMDMSTFVTKVCSLKDGRFWCPDWYLHYKAWGDAFGKCKVIFYDEIRTNLFENFLKAAGLKLIPDIPEIEPIQVSLGVYQMAYLLREGKQATVSEFMCYRSASKRASQHLGFHSKQSLLSSSDRQRLINYFDKSNRLLLEELDQTGSPEILKIDAESTNYCNLDKLYSSPEYTHYKEIADGFYINQT